MTDITELAKRTEREVKATLERFQRDRGLPGPVRVYLLPQFDAQRTRIDGEWSVTVKLASADDVKAWGEALGVTVYETEGIVDQPDGSWVVYRRVTAWRVQWWANVALDVEWADVRTAVSEDRKRAMVGALLAPDAVGV